MGWVGFRRPDADRPVPSHALSEAEQARIIAVANEPRFSETPPARIVPALADEGIYIASESSFHRVLRVARSNGNCVLEVHDDGRGGSHPEGNGIRGMRERVEALGGSVLRDTSAGTKLRFEFPLAPTNGTN